MPPEARYRPLVCVWELTLRCQARCIHCGSDAGSPRGKELSTGEGLKLVGELAALGCQSVTLSGGEPLLRPDWPTLARSIREAGMGLEMISNGLAATEQAGRIVGCGFSAVTFSVDGAGEAHDHLRGVPGGLDRLLQGAATLTRRGVRVAAVTQVNRANLADLERIHELLVGHGFAGWQIQLTMPLGRARGGTSLCLEPMQLPDLAARIVALQQHGELFIQAADNLGYLGRDEPRLRSGVGRPASCWLGGQAGLEVVGITSHGRVRGRLSLPPAYEEGSLRRRSLAEIWNAPGAFAFTRQFHTELLTAACAGCELGEVCRAGCASLAHAATGSPHGNPYCLRRLEQRVPEGST